MIGLTTVVTTAITTTAENIFSTTGDGVPGGEGKNKDINNWESG